MEDQEHPENNGNIAEDYSPETQKDSGDGEAPVESENKISATVSEERDEKILGNETKNPKKRGRKPRAQNGENIREEGEKSHNLSGVCLGIGSDEENGIKRPRRSCRKEGNANQDLCDLDEMLEEEERQKKKLGWKKRGRKPAAMGDENGVGEDGKKPSGRKKREKVEEDDGSKVGSGSGRKKKEVKVCTPGVCENASEKKDGVVSTDRPRRMLRSAKVVNSSEDSKPKSKVAEFDENGIKIDSMMCHQCQRNDKGEVVRCTKCKTKRYCKPCLKNWYPRMKEEEIAQACPVCLGNCNCKACLRMDADRKSVV